MAKYSYDKSLLKGLTTKDFMNQVKLRQSKIDEAPADIPTSVYNPNRLAAELHPAFVWGRINKIIAMPAGKTYIIGPAPEKGTNALPYFHACQHICVELDMEDKFTRRNYCITSTPKAALGDHGFYQIVVADHGPGHASEFILNTWKEGDFIRFGAPSGETYYEPLRDSKELLAIGIGGPAMALCQQVADGDLDVNLTAVALVPVPAGLGAMGAYKAMEAKSRGKVKCIPVLLNGEAEGVLHGPVTPELLKNLLTDPATGAMKDSTIFITCPDPLASVLEMQFKALGIPQRRIRKDPQGDDTPAFNRPDYPAEKEVKTYKLKLWVRGECTELSCRSDRPIAEAVESAKIRLKTSCRAGECGMCHSRLISGEYYMPASLDGRREADRKFGWIHPCCTYPLSDMEIEIFPEMI